MATQPLTEPEEFRFAPYIKELQEFFATSRVPFGSPEDLPPIAALLHVPGTFADDLSSLVRSFILRQGGAMPHGQLLEILALAIGGQQLADSPQQYREPLRELLGFVSGVMRRPWNVPPGEPAEVLEFPLDPARTSQATVDANNQALYDPFVEPADSTPISIAEASTPPLISDDPLLPQTPSDPIPALDPSPVSPAMPQSVAPVSAISAALAAEAERMARPYSVPPATSIHPAALRTAERTPAAAMANSTLEPELLQRTKAGSNFDAHSESDSDSEAPLLDDAPDSASDLPRTARLRRNVPIAVVAVLILCAGLVFAYRSRNPGEKFAVTQLTPSQASQQTASGNSSQTAPLSTQTPIAAVTAPAAQTYSSGTSKPSPYGPQLTARQLRHGPRPAPRYTGPDIAEPYSSSPKYAPGQGSNQPSVPNQAPVQPRPAGAIQSAQQNTTAFSTYSPYNGGANRTATAPATSSPPAGQAAAPVVRASTPSREQIPQPPRQPALHDPDASYVGELPAGTQYSSASTGRTSSFTVSSGVMAANLISSPEPEYPTLARLAHVQGQVILQAIVAKDGTVSNTRVLRGNRLLRGAAEEAVRRWRYRPYRINDRPVDVATIVTVDFHD